MANINVPTPEENPNGFHGRYRIMKADGSECDPAAIYFVLRIDKGGSDPVHIDACRTALLKYANTLITAGHMTQLAHELIDLLIDTDSP